MGRKRVLHRIHNQKRLNARPRQPSTIQSEVSSSKTMQTLQTRRLHNRTVLKNELPRNLQPILTMEKNPANNLQSICLYQMGNMASKKRTSNIKSF